MKVPEGLIDPKSYYIGYEDGKKAPQTKPLSDEEIADMVCSGEYWKVDGLTIISVDFAKFARAIEERLLNDL